jgi:hypothetical protein
MTFRTIPAAALLAVLALIAVAPPRASAAEPDLAAFRRDLRTVQSRLQTFDELDFVVFTGQKWDRLHESHTADITVHWPDGRVTHGIEPHIADLKAMFVFAPDTRIHEHPVRFGSGEWTAVIGTMEGTFSKPMPTPDGHTIAPTGKSFRLQMSTIGHWRGGQMDEEYLFWDNAAFLKQIGLGN